MLRAAHRQIVVWYTDSGSKCDLASLSVELQCFLDDVHRTKVLHCGGGGPQVRLVGL